MPPRVCVDTITDSRGIRHSVEVTAESLFEAGVIALGTLRKAGWMEESPGLGTRLEIEVREFVTHTVTVQQAAVGGWRGQESAGERMREMLMIPTMLNFPSHAHGSRVWHLPPCTTGPS